MYEIVNVHEAKTHLSRLLERVAEGEEIVIGKAGKPVARLVPYQASQEPRKPGALKGQIWMADDWDSDEVNREIEDLFYSSDIEPST
jgi:prevent-host-death family protein